MGGALEDGKAAYFFGETPADRTYKLPGSIAKAEVMSWSQEGEPQELNSSLWSRRNL
ncbi:MAG: hypothetical protein R3C56_27945 [Pirellulaceae bacterium]